jgi:hypothetical protein
VNTQPNAWVAADRTTGDAAPLVPTAAPATPPADHAAADHVTAREIAEFLGDLARFRSPPLGGDPADHAALLARKAELLRRIADQHARTTADPLPATAPTAPEGRTP